MRRTPPIATLGIRYSLRPHARIIAVPRHTVGFRTSAVAVQGEPSRPPIEPQSVLGLVRTRPRRGKWSRLVIALGWIPVAAFITSHVCSIGNVTGASMSPTFNGPREEALAPGAGSDVVLLNRVVQVSQEYQVGDIVTLISPLEPRLLLTKRILALPGDMVRTWAPAADDANLSKGKGRWTNVKVPPGHVWIEGDAAVEIAPSQPTQAASSRSASLQTKSRDSREFGPVPMGLITSRISYILWPPQRFGRPAPRPTTASTSKNQYPPSESSADATSSLDAMQQEFDDLTTQVSPSLSRILDNLMNTPREGRTKAHPQDSALSPYVDWDDNHRPPKTAQADEKDAASQHRFKHLWNGLSRGGKLGDDAE